jgi:hypothetical protein
MLITQDRQCTCKAILMRVHANYVTVEKQYYTLWAFVYSLTYPACNAHAQYLLPSATSPTLH